MSELMTSPKVFAKNRPYYSKYIYFFINAIFFPEPYCCAWQTSVQYWIAHLLPTPCLVYLSALLTPSELDACFSYLRTPFHFSLQVESVTENKMDFTVQELVLSVFNQSLIPDLKDVYHNSLSPFR